MTIVASASPPMLCGPAFTAPQRAKYFASKGWQVKLVLPYILYWYQCLLAWLGTGAYFGKTYTPLELEALIRQRFDLGQGISIEWYSAFSLGHTVLALGTLFKHLEGEGPIIFEEPEHLLFTMWPFKFFEQSRLNAHPCRLGILHTNYHYYITHGMPFGWLAAWLFSSWSDWVLPGLCTQMLAISPSLFNFKNEPTVFARIHGIAEKYFDVERSNLKGTYYLGQLQAAGKNLYQLIDWAPVGTDIWGHGSDRAQLERYAKGKVNFRGVAMDPSRDVAGYKTYISTSLSEGLATATMEAIVMGKFVIIPEHPSNSLFDGFANVLFFSSRSEFESHLAYTESHQPVVEPPEKLDVFRWSQAHAALEAYLPR